MCLFGFLALAENGDNPVLDLRNGRSAESRAAEYKKVLDDAAVALSNESMCRGCIVGVDRRSAQVKETASNNQFAEEENENAREKSQNFANNLKPESKHNKLNGAPEDCLPKLQFSDLVIKEPENDPAILLDGFAHGMITRPCRAVKQVLGVDLEPEAVPEGIQGKTHKAGQAVGALVPFVGLVAITRTAGSGFLTDMPPLARVLGEQAGAGFIMGSLFTPTDVKPGQSLLSARIEQGSKSAATFATLTGTSASLDQELPSFGDDKFSIVARRVTIGLVTGTIGGFIDPRGITSLGASKEDSLSSAVLFQNKSKEEQEAAWLSKDWSSTLSSRIQQFAAPEDPAAKKSKQ